MGNIYDAPAWIKTSTKPSYSYSEIGYTVDTITSAGGTVSLAGTTPLHVVTLTGNVSALTLSANPAEGHSCHDILTAASAQKVAIAHDATYSAATTTAAGLMSAADFSKLAAMQERSDDDIDSIFA